MPTGMQKSRGFTGELIIEIPKVALAQSERSPLINRLFIAKMGFYPKAMHHYYQRPKGISQIIFLYCTDGKGWIQFKKKKVVMEAGTMYVIPAGLPHIYGADENNPWTIYWFHFAGKGSSEVVTAIMGDKPGIAAPVQAGFSEQRNAVFKQIADTFLKGYSTSNLLFANLLLVHYLTTIISPEQFQPAAYSSTGAGATDKAIFFMQRHLTQTVTLQAIAQSVHLSVSFFSRKFKTETGYAPIEYFNHLRIQRACQLLHFSSLRINEVASKVGITDPFYFSRLFKQQIGISPARYRKNKGE